MLLLYGDASDFRRSSAVTSGVSLVWPPPAAAPTAPPVVQGSKSYMDVSMSANRTSSRAKSERNPEGEEEDGEEGVEEPSIKPPGGSAGRASIIRISAQRLSANETPADSGLAPVDLQSLVGPVGDGEQRAVKWEDWASGVRAEEVVTVVQLDAAVLVMAVGGPTSMSLRAEGKLLDEACGGALEGRSASGNCGA